MESSDIDIIAKIAGNVVVSNNPGEMLKIWRKRLKIKQTNLAKKMNISPSVLSDYESGRRYSPGIVFIKKYIESLVILDKSNNKTLNRLLKEDHSAILGIGEFKKPITAEKLNKILNINVLNREKELDTKIYGYTIVDSINTIYMLSGIDFYKIFGATTERVLIFTRVGIGRSPLVAIRVSQLKPRMVILHGPDKIDKLAVDLADKDKIILGLTKDNETRIKEKLIKLWPLIYKAIWKESMLIDSQYLIFTVIILIASIIVLKLKILDFIGTISSIFMGNLIYLVTGIWGFILVIEFFIIGFICTRFRFKQKRRKGIAQEKGGIRSWENVVANGFAFSLFGTLYYLTSNELFLIGFITSIAIATGDTLATEIGLLSSKKPRLITNFKEVETGKSGGITVLGTIASILGIMIIILSSSVNGFSFNTNILMISIIGAIFGTFIDSIIGATIQAQYFCNKCNKFTELSIHHEQQNKLIKGFSFIDNNIVNLLSTLSGSMISILFIIVFY